jgi:ammonium transporter, Amt family
VSAVNAPFKDAAGNPLPVGLLEGNASQLLNQGIGVAISIGVAVVATFVILKVVDIAIGVRVSEEDEAQGLDLSQHGEEGYNLDLDLMSPSATMREASSPGLVTAARAAEK